MTKKLLGIFLLTTALLFTGCANSTTVTSDEVVQETTTEETQDTISIVATSFHEYDWLLQVIGENSEYYDISLLLDNGVDLHSYEPTVDDIATIVSADLFIYNGGESDAWVADILALNTELNTINVIEVLDDYVLDTVIVEGMEESEHDHDHDDEATEEEHDHDHDDEATEEESHVHTDEHIWMSLENAAIVCAHFADALSELDSDNETIYQENASNYIAQLNALDEAYEAMVDEATRDTIIVTDRFPFLYLVTDYGINYYAAFDGCSAETEASFSTIVFLAEKADEYDVNYLLTIENGLTDLATTVASNSSDANREVLELNSIQSVTSADIDAGMTYYSIMEENLEILKLALSE